MNPLRTSLLAAAIMLIAALPRAGFSQIYYPECGMPDEGEADIFAKTSYVDSTHNTWIPSHTDFSNGETLHSIVLIVRFPGDTVTNSNWDTDIHTLPDYMANILDTSGTFIDGKGNNISDYYYLNSNGRFLITGETFYLTLSA